MNTEIRKTLDRYRIDCLPEIHDLAREPRMILVCIHESLFDEDLTVNRIKAECRIKNNNVSTRFRYAMGKGIKEYIETHRMAAASQLLCRGDFSIFEIAMATGYCYVETFYQAFRRHFDCTPGEHRRRHCDAR